MSGLVASAKQAGAADRHALSVSSNYPEAVAIVTRLYDQFGFDTGDNSPARESWRSGPGQPAWIAHEHQIKSELIANLAKAEHLPPCVNLLHAGFLKRNHNMTQRDAIFPANRHALYEAHGYSAAIRSGDLLFVSGQVGSRPDGAPEPDFAAQVRLAFANLKAVLEAGGCTFDDIVDVTSFHTDPENQFPTIMAVKSEVFSEPPYPNWTAVGVNWLAGFDFEIKVIARIPGDS